MCFVYDFSLGTVTFMKMVLVNDLVFGLCIIGLISFYKIKELTIFHDLSLLTLTLICIFFAVISFFSLKKNKKSYTRAISGMTLFIYSIFSLFSIILLFVNFFYSHTNIAR